jgi:2'-5' RNA ligase
MQRWVIMIFPEREGLEAVEALRRRYDPLANQIPAHITLVFPFSTDLSQERLRRHLADAVRGMAPFPVRLRDVTGHEGEYLFLNVKRGNNAPFELHDRLYSGPLTAHRSNEHTFVPHLTVGRLPDREAFHAALEEVRNWPGELDVTVRSVSAYRIAEDGGRSIDLEVSLGGTVVREVSATRKQGPL